MLAMRTCEIYHGSRRRPSCEIDRVGTVLSLPIFSCRLLSNLRIVAANSSGVRHVAHRQHLYISAVTPMTEGTAKIVVQLVGTLPEVKSQMAPPITKNT